MQCRIKRPGWIKPKGISKGVENTKRMKRQSEMATSFALLIHTNIVLYKTIGNNFRHLVQYISLFIYIKIIYDHMHNGAKENRLRKMSSEATNPCKALVLLVTLLISHSISTPLLIG